MFSSATTRRGVLLSSGAASSLRRLPCVCVGLAVRVGGSGVPKGPVLLACARAVRHAGSRDPSRKFRVPCSTVGVGGTNRSATRRLWTPDRPENGSASPVSAQLDGASISKTVFVMAVC